jgi:hypothetical protein
LFQIMPFCPITKTSDLEWNQWPALDFSVRILPLDGAHGFSGSVISEMKGAFADAQSLQGARAVGRTLLQCLKQTEKINDGNSTQELQAAVLAHSSYSSIMSGGASFPLCHIRSAPASCPTFHCSACRGRGRTAASASCFPQRRISTSFSPACSQCTRAGDSHPHDMRRVFFVRPEPAHFNLIRCLLRAQNVHLERVLHAASGTGTDKASSAPHQLIHLTAIANVQAPLPPLRRALLNHGKSSNMRTLAATSNDSLSAHRRSRSA